MAALTFYMTSNLAGTAHQEMSLTDPGTEAFASPATGWVVGTGSTNHSALDAQTERASSTFTATTDPDGTPTTTSGAGDCLRSTDPLWGTFASANWTFSFCLRGITQSGAQDGRIRFRLLRGTNPTGSGATDISGSQQQASLITDMPSGSTSTSSLTVNPGAITLTGEYLFVQVAWERTGAGGMSTTNVQFRVGNASGNGTRVVTSDFTPTQFHAFPQTWRKAEKPVNKLAIAVVAASGLTLCPSPLIDYCAFQPNAFQNDAFQLCPEEEEPNFGWYQPLSRAPKAIKPPYYQFATWHYAPPAVADNTVTVDKWQQPLSQSVKIPRAAPSVGGIPFIPAEATRDNTTSRVWPLTQGETARPIPRTAPQGSHLFVPKEATLENTDVRVWPLTQGEIARPTLRPAKQGHHLFVPDETTSRNTTTRVWPLTQGERARPIARVAPQGHHLFVPREATRENTTNTVWPLVIRDESAIPIPRAAPPGQSVSGYPYEAADNTRTEWDWYLSFPDRAPHTFAKQGHHLFVPAEATVDNTTVKVWPLTQGERARPIQRPAPQGWIAFGYPYEGVDNTRTEWDWLAKFRDSAVPISRPAPRGGSPFFPKEATSENTTNTVWPLTQGEKARPIARPAPQGHHLFVPREATSENTTVRVWPLVVEEKALPIPRAAKPGVVASGFPYEAVDNTRTEWDWHVQWPAKAVPIPRPAQTAGKPFVPDEATVQNTTTRVWPLTSGEKARPIQRPAPQGGWFFGYPYEQQDNSRLEWDWQVSQGEKPRPIPRPAPQGGWFFGYPYPAEEPAAAGGPDTWMMAWRGPPRIKPCPGWFVVQQRYGITYEQTVTATIEFSVDLHICAWGTEAEVSVAFAEQAEAGDVWTIQAPEEERLVIAESAFQECVGDPAFQADAFQNCDSFSATVVETSYEEQGEQSDPWSTQGEGSGDWEEQEECGR